jgi:hypothetical protein
VYVVVVGRGGFGLSLNSKWGHLTLVTTKSKTLGTLFFFPLLLLSLFLGIFCCCAGWGYIVSFTKVLTIYHTWVHPLSHSPLTSLFPIRKSWVHFHNKWSFI